MSSVSTPTDVTQAEELRLFLLDLVQVVDQQAITLAQAEQQIKQLQQQINELNL